MAVAPAAGQTLLSFACTRICTRLTRIRQVDLLKLKGNARYHNFFAVGQAPVGTARIFTSDVVYVHDDLESPYTETLGEWIAANGRHSEFSVSV